MGMISVKYRIKGSGITTIYVRLTFNKKRIEKSTGLKIQSDHFDSENGIIHKKSRFEGKDILEAKLLELTSKLMRLLAENKSQVSYAQIEGVISGKVVYDQVMTISDAFKNYIEYLKNDKENTPEESTLKTYGSGYNRIRKFEEYRGVDSLIIDINAQYKKEFISWSKNIQNYSVSTYQKTIKQIKSCLRHYQDVYKIIIDQSFISREESIAKMDKNVPSIHLSISEIQMLIKYNGKGYLENARDWLVISCYTGCRVSDLMRLSSDDLRYLNGHKYIEITQIKTRAKVQIPIHPEVERIIRVNGGFPRPISDQKYNEFIKVLCFECGFTQICEGYQRNSQTKNRKKLGSFPKWQLVTSHIGRRSFATNLYGKMKNVDIMKITGHRTEAQFLEYIGQMNQDHFSDFFEAYK